MKETAEQYVERKIKEAKEFYITPENMLDEMTRLIEGVKGRDSVTEREKWELAVALSEAWHVIIWVKDEDKAKRLVNTIVSFVKETVAI